MNKLIELDAYLDEAVVELGIKDAFDRVRESLSKRTQGRAKAMFEKHGAPKLPRRKSPMTKRYGIRRTS